MALIPLTQKFTTLDAGQDTTEKKSKLLNGHTQTFTMADIVQTAGGGEGGEIDLSGIALNESRLDAFSVILTAQGVQQDTNVALLATLVAELAALELRVAALEA